MTAERTRSNHGDDDDDHDRYFELESLTRYCGLSLSTLRRFLRDPEKPLPHHVVRPAGKQRGGRILVSKRKFDAWVESFPGVKSTAQGELVDVSWIKRAFRKD